MSWKFNWEEHNWFTNLHVQFILKFIEYFSSEHALTNLLVLKCYSVHYMYVAKQSQYTKIDSPFYFCVLHWDMLMWVTSIYFCSRCVYLEISLLKHTHTYTQNKPTHMYSQNEKRERKPKPTILHMYIFVPHNRESSY